MDKALVEFQFTHHLDICLKLDLKIRPRKNSNKIRTRLLSSFNIERSENARVVAGN
jgi:hypothetical protein